MFPSYNIPSKLAQNFLGARDCTTICGGILNLGNFGGAPVKRGHPVVWDADDYTCKAMTNIIDHVEQA